MYAAPDFQRLQKNQLEKTHLPDETRVNSLFDICPQRVIFFVEEFKVLCPRKSKDLVGFATSLVSSQTWPISEDCWAQSDRKPCIICGSTKRLFVTCTKVNNWSFYDKMLNIQMSQHVNLKSLRLSCYVATRKSHFDPSTETLWKRITNPRFIPTSFDQN